MERCLLIMVGLIVTVAFVPTMVFFLRSIYHFIRMQSQYRSGRHNFVANMVPFLFPFSPTFFTEQGNFHRKEFIKNFVWFVFCFAAIWAIYALLGIGN